MQLRFPIQVCKCTVLQFTYSESCGKSFAALSSYLLKAESFCQKKLCMITVAILLHSVHGNHRAVDHGRCSKTHFFHFSVTFRYSRTSPHILLSAVKTRHTFFVRVYVCSVCDLYLLFRLEEYALLASSNPMLWRSLPIAVVFRVCGAHQFIIRKTDLVYSVR